ncbi:hypothetical protein NMG29_28120 [Streptomyces cocklensis]|uniref:Uncharacterized protein n=1 Tax=Actinacidiphila cocklensis TaxID=887465 RepID=A0A9W4GXF5_9ACTN|nr:hypothetical protein [Actinacidiphila cocklensis]CAG6398710.1 hypothetical protein SCOCK_740016 [Actinacidiphila cocklensis]
MRGPLPQLEDRSAVPRPRVLRALAAVVGSVAAVALLVLGDVPPGDSDSPPALVRGISRLLDAPRRINGLAVARPPRAGYRTCGSVRKSPAIRCSRPATVRAAGAPGSIRV